MKRTYDYCYYKFYTILMFNFQIFLVLSICDNVKETRSVDSETASCTPVPSVNRNGSIDGRRVQYLNMEGVTTEICNVTFVSFLQIIVFQYNSLP